MISAGGPLLGGLVATTLGYPVLMSAALAFLGASFLLIAFKVNEPRRRVAHVVTDAINAA